MKRVLLLLVIGISLFSRPLLAQTSSTTQTFLLEASHAFGGNQPVSSVALIGDANFVAGGTRTTGAITLIARADGSSQFQFSAGTASRNELQDTFTNGQGCTWSGNDNIVHAAAGQNCMLPFAWFLPQPGLFSAELPGSGIFEVAVPASTTGQTVLHWSPQSPPDFTSEQAALLSHAGSWDLYFDTGTLLPTEIRYAAHPDSNAALNIPVRIVYSDYRVVDGAEIPFRIRRYFNGVLSFDITIDNATVSH